MTNPSRKTSDGLGNLVSTLGGVTAAVLAATLSFTYFVAGKQEASQVSTIEKLSELASTIQITKKKVHALEEQLRSAIEASQLSATTPETSVLVSEISGLSNRMQKIESWIVHDPEQAVAIPLLTKEIDELTKSVDYHIQNTNRAFDRFYSIGQWFIAIIVAVIVGILGPSIGNLLRSRKPRPKVPQVGTTPDEPS